jgi:hypothetical protein
MDSRSKNNSLKRGLQYINSIDNVNYALFSALHWQRAKQGLAMTQKVDLIEQPVQNKAKAPAPAPDEAEVVRRILRALANLDYGSVEIIVQDSKVVQIERTQRSRFSQPLEIPKVG